MAEKNWTAEAMAEYLTNLVDLDVCDDDSGEAPSVVGMQTFADAGVLTSDTGFVLTLSGRRKVYVTVQVQPY